MPASPRSCPSCRPSGADARAVAARRRRAGRRGRGPVRRACSTRSGIGPVRFLPPRRADGAAAGRARTPASCWRSPSSPTRRARSKSAARTRLAAPFPLGVEGTTAWLQAAADAFGVAPRRVRARHARRPRARARRRWRATATQLAGKRIFFFPDSQLEIPLARFLSRELGMQLVEVGTPYLHRQHLADELALLPAGTHAERRPGRRPPARPLPRGAARPRGLRPRPRQSARGRRAHHQVVDRTGLHADPGLRAGRRPRRTVRAPARAPRHGWWPDHAAHRLDLRRPAACRRDAHRHRDGGRALRAARAAGRHLRRPAVHDDRAAQQAPAGHLHDLPGARPRRRHRRAVQDAPRATPTSASSRRR